MEKDKQEKGKLEGTIKIRGKEKKLLGEFQVAQITQVKKTTTPKKSSAISPKTTLQLSKKSTSPILEASPPPSSPPSASPPPSSPPPASLSPPSTPSATAATAPERNWWLIGALITVIVFVAIIAIFTLPHTNDFTNDSIIVAPVAVANITHEEALGILRTTFPLADVRGAEEEVYDIIDAAQYKAFLENPYISSKVSACSGGDKVATLIGLFSSTPGWQNVPIGFAKESDGEIYIITVVGFQSCQCLPAEIKVVRDFNFEEPLENENDVKYVLLF